MTRAQRHDKGTTYGSVISGLLRRVRRGGVRPAVDPALANWQALRT
jgi:hypothetical protein